MATAVIGALRVALELGTASWTRGLSKAEADVENFSKRMRKAGRRMESIGKTMTLSLTAPVIAFGAATVQTAGNFEQAMNRAQAVSGATGAELDKMREAAKKMGRETQFSATEAADALGFLTMAGFSAAEATAALPGTLQLAASAQMELGETADIVSNILTGYGMKVEDLGRANDVLAKTFTSTNTNLEQLGVAMKYAGPIASAAGVEFESAAAAIGLMGNAGIQADMAGTSLRGAISRILSPTKKMAGAMRDAGLNFTDAEGRLIPLADIVRQLEPHANDAGLFMEIFGQRAGPAMAGLVSQGADALVDLETKLQNAGGTAQRIADVQMQGFNGSMKRLKSAFEGFQIALAESGLIDTIAAIVEKLAGMFSALGNLSPVALQVITVVGMLAAALGPLLIVAGSAMQVFGPMVASLGAAATAAGGFGALLAPVLPILAGVAAAAAAAYAIWKNWDTIGPVLGNLKEQIVETFGPPLLRLWEAVKKAAIALFESELVQGLIKLGKIVVTFQMAVVKAFGSAIPGVLKALGAAFSGAMNMIADVLNFIVALLTGDWQGAWDAALSFVDNFGTMVQGVFGGLLEAVVGFISSMVSSIDEWLGGKLGRIWDRLKEGVEAAKGYFFDLYDAVVGNSYIPDMVDEIGAHMVRLDTLMVKKAGEVTSKTGEAFRKLAQDLRPLLDRLFPSSAALVQYRRDLELLDQALEKNLITLEQHAAARARLGRDFRGEDVEGGRPKPKLDWMEDFAAANEISPETLRKLQREIDVELFDPLKNKTAEAAQRFAEMSSDILGSLRGMVSAFKSGDILGGIMGLLDMLGQVVGLIGGTGAPATRVKSIGNYGGGKAMGGPVVAGKTYRVGERGPEWFTPSTGGHITPNGGGGGGNTYQISGNLLTPEFWQQIQAMDDQAAQRGALGGMQMAMERSDRNSRFSLSRGRR